MADELDKALIRICDVNGGASLEEISSKTFNTTQQNLVQTLNRLLEKGQIDIVQKGSVLYYRSVSDTELSQCSFLNEDEVVVLKCIKATGNIGIWSRDIKIRSGLHQAIITKALKSLENKKLIKTIKAAKSSTRKLYMLYDLEPSSEISGGPWFTEFELDNEFIDDLSGSIDRLLEPLLSSYEPGCILPISHFPTLSSLTVLIGNAHICNIDISKENINQVVNRLTCDGIIHSTTADHNASGWEFICKRSPFLSLFGCKIGESFI